MTKIEFEVVNGIGTVLATSPDFDLAKRWVKENVHRFPSIYVREVQTTIVTRTAYRPRVAA